MFLRGPQTIKSFFYYSFLVSTLTANYPYIAYLQDLLNYSPDAQNHNLWAQGWEMDHAGKFEDIGNGGYVNRRSRFLKTDTTILNAAMDNEEVF